MNAKFASLVIVSVLSWATVGGCPAPVDIADGVTTPDSNGSENSGSSTPSSDGASAGSGTTDGSAGPGTADSASDTSGDGTGPDADGGSAPGDDGSGADDDADAGDSTDGDDSDDEDTSPVFQGTYSGQIQRVKRESLGGPLGSEQQWTTTFSITFDSNGMPTAFLIPGYGQTEGGIDFMPEVNRVGQTVTLTESSGSYSATLTVTVAVATYEETSARVVLSLEHFAQEGSRTEEGTGIQVIEYGLEGDGLAYSSLTTYEVELRAGDISLDTIWEVACEGTLSPE